MNLEGNVRFLQKYTLHKKNVLANRRMLRDLSAWEIRMLLCGIDPTHDVLDMVVHKRKHKNENNICLHLESTTVNKKKLTYADAVAQCRNKVTSLHATCDSDTDQTDQSVASVPRDVASPPLEVRARHSSGARRYLLLWQLPFDTTIHKLIECTSRICGCTRESIGNFDWRCCTYRGSKHSKGNRCWKLYNFSNILLNSLFDDEIHGEIRVKDTAKCRYKFISNASNVNLQRRLARAGHSRCSGRRPRPAPRRAAPTVVPRPVSRNIDIADVEWQCISSTKSIRLRVGT